MVGPKIKSFHQQDSTRVQLKHRIALSKRDSIDIQLNQLFDSMKVSLNKFQSVDEFAQRN